MPDIAEMDSYAMLCEDWGSAYQITRTPGQDHPYRAERRDDPAVVLTAAESRRAARADPRGLPGPSRPPGGCPVTGPRQPATSQAAVPGTVAVPKHPVSALTTFELRDYRRDLERAIRGIAADAPVQADLRRKLAAVIAEQDDRARMAADARA